MIKTSLTTTSLTTTSLTTTSLTTKEPQHLWHFLGGALLGLFAPLVVAVGLLTMVWGLEQMTGENLQPSDSQTP
ncbi:MAG: hypothetical protein HC924_13290 [Synechococcaceae cyanobacterium SM2_3_2]|nr:hypothetical protein [Synechococcaceae cyanobacterium SM2_3_2]